MEILKMLEGLNQWREENSSHSIGFVPTMGAIHDGHLALVKDAKAKSDSVIVSIFLNPTQFSADEDLDNYPKTLDQDIALLEAEGADALWLPSIPDIYPKGLEVDVKLGGITKILEGEYRPHFFDGVATVVKRLFYHVQPDMAFLGEKDFQQLQVIRQLVKKFDMSIEIIGFPTVRIKSGLALSSRNSYLSNEQVEQAIILNKIMQEFANSDMSEGEAESALIDAGFDKVDYITKRNSETFTRENADRVLVAAWIDKTRLIDNMSFLHSE